MTRRPKNTYPFSLFPHHRPEPIRQHSGVPHSPNGTIAVGMLRLKVDSPHAKELMEGLFLGRPIGSIPLANHEEVTFESDGLLPKAVIQDEPLPGLYPVVGIGRHTGDLRSGSIRSQNDLGDPLLPPQH